MTFGELKVPPPGRSSSRWFLFLTFYHLLPTIWFLAVAGGLAPASFLLAGGIASLFSGDSDGFAFAAFLLAPALLVGLVFYLVAWLLAALIGRLRHPLVRTLSLLGIFGACLIAAMQPIFISGGHSSSNACSLFDFTEVLGEFRVPASYIVGYFTGLGLVLLALLIHQHLGSRLQAISAQEWLRRRRLRRRMIVAGILILLLSLGWTHRTALFVKPLADLGFASAQYQLAMVLKEQSIARRGRPGGYQDWLVRAADGGYAEAQYRLVTYYENQAGIMRSDPDRGVALLTAAAQQNHLPAIGALALGYEKGRYSLPRYDGTREGKLKFRADAQQLRKQYNELRDAEIARLKSGE